MWVLPNRSGLNANYQLPETVKLFRELRKSRSSSRFADLKSDKANYTERTFESAEQVAVGGAGMYEGRCRSCVVPHADADGTRGVRVLESS